MVSKLSASTQSFSGVTIWNTTALVCAIWPVIGVPSAITPVTGAISGIGSLRILSSAARRSFSPSSSSRVSSSVVRATAPLVTSDSWRASLRCTMAIC